LVDGVLSLSYVTIVNKTSKDGTYSDNEYDINAATANGIVYPSLNPYHINMVEVQKTFSFTK